MTKALLDPSPERKINEMALFSVNKGEINHFPEVFLHKFEFLEPLLLCYDEKILRLEQTVFLNIEKINILYVE